MKAMARGKISLFPKLVLTGLSLSCLFYGFRNYNALLNSDQYSYLSFARALARGSLYQEYPLYRIFADRVPPGRSVNLHYGTRNYRDGKVYSGLPIGFPLLLALALKLGGLPAVFAVNVILLLVFLLAYYLAVRELFRPYEGGEEIALFSSIIILSLGWKLFPRYSLILMRDIPSVAFFWVGFCCLLLARRRSKVRMVLLLLGAGIGLAFSCTIRLTNIILCLPLGCYGLFFFKGKLSRAGIFLLVSGVVLLFLLIFSPILIENYFFNRNPLAPFKYALKFSSFSSPGEGRTMFSLGFFFRHLPANLKLLYSVFSWPGVLLLAAGIALFRRMKEVWLILIPIPLLHILLYSMFEEDYQRYLVPLYPYLTVLVGAGTIRVLGGGVRIFTGTEKGKTGWNLWGRIGGILLLGWAVRGFILRSDGSNWQILLALIAGVYLLLPRSWRKGFSPRLRSRSLIGVSAFLLVMDLGLESFRAKNFGLGEVKLLRSRIEEEVPDNSIVWGARYLIQNIDFYTRAWGIDPVHLQWPFSLTMKEVVERILKADIPLYILDNKGVKTTSHYLDQISRNFDLEKVKSWKSRSLALQRLHYSQNEFLNLYRINPWEERIIRLALATPEKMDYLLVIDLKNAPLPAGGDEKIQLLAGGSGIPARLRPGLNFILLSAGVVEVPRTVVEVVSPLPLSRDIFLDLVPAEAGYLLEAGREKGIPDYLFLEKGFSKGSSASSRRLKGKSRIRIPHYSLNGFRPLLKLRMRNESSGSIPLNLRLELAGELLAEYKLEAQSGWQVVECPLPDRGKMGTTSSLSLTLSMGEKSDWSRAALSLDWVRLEQVPINN